MRNGGEGRARLLLIILIVTSLFLITLDLRGVKILDGIRGGTQNVLAPFQKAGSTLFSPFRNFVGDVTQLGRTRDQIEKLKADNAKPRSKLLLRKNADGELSQLKSVLDLAGRAGYEVVAQATNGQEAIDLAIEHKPDLAILDVKMPILDGITAAERIIQIAPVLMLTAFSQKELVDRARDAGVMAYVVKPFTIGDLMPAIEIAISRHLQMRSLADEVADLHDRLETRKLIDRAKGILMKALNLSEPEAFSWIQRAAMDRRLSMKDVAEAVINPNAVPDK
jgi:AmiR/NasT family two-component response regulator